ncbi:MAG: electron transfer flavoprotein [Deltaproteobacteria bacterium CG11_big_fil_rev_8_21_14_0_20_47_16]|nr:MAG: electron transfer flavoprotein [Deltaproteobacteria bacterium CG11_big_fil_rev_8_21_14_0_20_47_16]
MSNIPADYKPPVQPGEFVSKPEGPADSQLNVGVLFVGGGPASLAGAIRLAQLLETTPEIKAGLGDFPIAIIEKGKYVGAHLLSGAVINPAPFRSLFPNLSNAELPFYGEVPGESVYFLTQSTSFPLPVPPTMKNHGNVIASLSKVGTWLAQQAEALGVTILPETAGSKLLVDDHAVVGVRTGDMGRGREGEHLANYTPGSEMLAKVTALGEGCIGHLTQAALEHFNIKRGAPQIYALGVKEVWEVTKPLDRIIHTMGWPLKLAKKYREFGGSFMYPMGDNKVAVGLVVGTDFADDTLSVHDLLQEMKLHPLFKKVLEGGKRLQWGAKAIPEGGFYALPNQLHLPGALILGDAAGMVNVPALKGIHYAMESGILAAETIFEQLKAGANLQAPNALVAYSKRVRDSIIVKDLHEVRNMRQAFHHGFFVGGFLASLMTLTKGTFPGWKMSLPADSAEAVFNGNRVYPKPDNVLTFDKLSSVYLAGNRSRDDQPNHIRIQTKVSEPVGQAWISMCPAGVYEWKNEGKTEIMINPSNCVQCGAITAKGARLTIPEGGSGPEYTEM